MRVETIRAIMRGLIALVIVMSAHLLAVTGIIGSEHLLIAWTMAIGYPAAGEWAERHQKQLDRAYAAMPPGVTR